jgi:diguanylate cyclase (GGDEF)-like protein
MTDRAESIADRDEDRRLAVLHSLALLDSGPQHEFDALVALAADLLGVPNAMLTLIDRDRQRVKAHVGAAPAEAPREIAFCNHTIRGDAVLVVEDAQADARFAGNPFVTAPDGLRFYAGVPIHAPDAEGTPHAIGALCVTDTAPRTLSATEHHTLLHLTTLAEAMIGARATALKAIDIARQAEQLATHLAQQDRVFRQAERLAMIGSWRLSLHDERMNWSEGVSRIHGLPPGHVPELQEALDYYPLEARGRVTATIARVIETGDPFDFEEDFVTAQGKPRRVRSIGELEVVNGQPVALVGVFQDITERHALETALRRNADTDALTSLGNRAAFDRELELAIGRAQGGDTPLMLLMIDLDGFKSVNDTLGHTAGDDVLRTVGNALRADWLRGSFAARLGGDEFAVLVEDPELTDWPAMVGERLDVSLRQTIEMDGVALATAGTVGWAMLDTHCTTARDFVHQVDSIMYAAKRARAGNRRTGDRRVADRPFDMPDRRGQDRPADADADVVPYRRRGAR